MEYRVLDRRTGEVRQDTGMAGVASYIRPGNPMVPFATRLAVSQLPAGQYRLEVWPDTPPASRLSRGRRISI
jgi:hypothetical protein